MKTNTVNTLFVIGGLACLITAFSLVLKYMLDQPGDPKGVYHVDCRVYQGVNYQQYSTRMPKFGTHGMMTVYPADKPPQVLYRMNNCVITFMEQK